MRARGNILVTGGCGFIGTAFLHHLFSLEEYGGTVVNVDKLTYAGNPLNVEQLRRDHGGRRYHFYREDITNTPKIMEILEKHQIQTIVHFAAESHVDRSIVAPTSFIETNIMGTFSLLEAAKAVWANDPQGRFHHISTDEVFGSLGAQGVFTEKTPYDPKSPYSASKASSDHLVRAYAHTYGMNTTLSNCSNNYGPWQFPEKLLPLMILNMQHKKPLPVYGDGSNVRDWLYVMDHVKAIDLILTHAKRNTTWNIGGDCERSNLELLSTLIKVYASYTGEAEEPLRDLITFVRDRPGHDFRYAIDHSLLTTEHGWTPQVSLEKGLWETVRWYLENPDWIESIKTGAYKNWIEANYTGR